MRLKSDFSEVMYVFSPLFLYIIINWASASVLEAGWSALQQYFFAAEFPVAYEYAVKVVWQNIHQLVPAAAGCFAVRRTAFLEIYSFSQKYPAKLRIDESSEESLSGEEKQARPFGASDRDQMTRNSSHHHSLGKSVRTIKKRILRPIPESMYPVLMVSFASMAVAFNAMFGTFFRSLADSAPVLETLPGVPGLLLKIAVQGLCMPLIEEIVFRGIFFSRLEKKSGLYAAAFFSAALFGIWHLAPLQMIYAFFAGLLLAFVYASTGRFAVPLAMHSICNITVGIISWTGALEYLCTPAWTAVFTAVSAAGFFSVWHASEAHT